MTGLVERLRQYVENIRGGADDPPKGYMAWQAADALEALQAERDEATYHLASLEAITDEKIKALQAERDAWKGRSDEAQGWSLSHLARAEAAEAHIEKLKNRISMLKIELESYQND